MNFPKGVGKFLGWLSRAREKASNPPTPPENPGFAGYDPGEGLVVEVIDDRTAQEFLYFNVKVGTPQSTNVAAMWYQIEKQKLFVGFKNTYVYEYLGITVELAYDFFTAVSKGQWVWDNLRTTRRAYQFVYSLNGRTPERMEDPAARSVKEAAGSLSILGRDPFSHTKSARRVKIKYARVRRAEAKIPKFARTVSFSYQFVHMKRQRAGIQKIRNLIRGR